MSEHVSIGGTRRWIEHGLGIHCIKTLFPLRGAHVAVAVPLCLATFKTNSVNHAVTKEFGKSSALFTLALSVGLTVILAAKLFGLY